MSVFLVEVRRRYCVLFSKVMEDLSTKLLTSDCLDAVASLAREHPNLQKLMIDVEYSSQETYPVYIRMAENSSGVIEQYFGGEIDDLKK